MKRYFLITMLVFGAFVSRAQITQLYLDTVCTDCPSAGYTCVQLWAELTHPNDVISTIYGLEGSPLSISTDCETCFYQDAVGNETGDMINCALIPFFPSLAYDTWVSIGRQCNNDGDGQLFTLQSPNQPWLPIDCDIEMTDIYGGAWFTTPNTVSAQAGADLKTILGQFTTCGSIEGCINAQVFVSYSGTGSSYINQTDLCFSSLGCTESGCTDPAALNYNASACLDNGFCLYPCAIDLTSAIITPPTCSYNTNGSVDLDGAGSQGLLRFYKNGASPNLNGIYNSLGNASYTFTLKDERFDDAAYNPGGMYGTCQLDTVIVLNTLPVTFTLGPSDAVTCNGDTDGCNLATATGGTGALSFEMMNCAGTQYILDDLGNHEVVSTPTFCEFPAGSWKYHVTDANGCTFNSSCFSITQPPALNINDIFTDNATCYNTADGGVNMQFLGGTGDVDYYVNEVFYENNFITGLLPGNYTVIGVDSNGCEDTDTFTVGGPTAVVVNANSTPTLCVGTSDGCVNAAAGGGNPGPYTYSMDNITFSSATQFCGLAAGDYTVYAHDSQGCLDTVDITVDSATALDAFITVNDVACNGGADGSINVTGTGGTPDYTYSIDGVNYTSAGDFTDLPVGPVTVYMMDGNDCAFQTEAEIGEPAALDLSIETTNVSCNGEEDGVFVVDVNGGTPDFDYYLEGILQISNVIDDLGADTYNITVVDANGCEISEDATITEPEELVITNVSSTDETSVGANDGTISIDVEGGTGDYTYSWTNDDGDEVSTDEDPDGLEPGTYNVVVTDENGCEVSIDTDVEIDNSIVELGNNISIQLNPNPTSGLFLLTLSGLQGEKLSYRIADARGRIVMEKELGSNNGVKVEEVDLNGSAAGVYYLTVIAGDHSRALKVVKE